MSESLNRSGRPHQGRTMRLEMRTTASPQQVWEAWADPVKLSQWFTDNARGEAKPGSTMYWIFEKFGYEIPYEVVDAIPGQLLSLGGELPRRPPFLLEVSIERQGGETVLRLVNSGFLGGDAKWDEEYEGVSSGWEMALGLLRYYLERHFGEPKRSFLLIEPAQCALAEVRRWYTEPELLAEWLADDAADVRAPSAVGDRVRIRLADGGGMIEGETLAVTRREVAFSWETEDVVLELKAFAMGPNPVVSIRGTAWQPDPARLAGIERAMGAALKRLAGRVAERPSTMSAGAGGG
jgi:uncharacterized protein YndB with AHSA1/START domain